MKDKERKAMFAREVNCVTVKPMIISGGQSGGDLGGIDAAKQIGLVCGINAEKGYKPLYDSVPKGVNIRIVSNKIGSKGGWVERRKYNIRNSDATVIFVDCNIHKTRGSLGTMRDALALGKPHIIIDVRNPDSAQVKLKRFIEKHRPKTLNVAGQRDLKRKLVSTIIVNAL